MPCRVRSQRRRLSAEARERTLVARRSGSSTQRSWPSRRHALEPRLTTRGIPALCIWSEFRFYAGRRRSRQPDRIDCRGGSSLNIDDPQRTSTRSAAVKVIERLHSARFIQPALERLQRGWMPDECDMAASRLPSAEAPINDSVSSSASVFEALKRTIRSLVEPTAGSARVNNSLKPHRIPDAADALSLRRNDSAAKYYRWRSGATSDQPPERYRSSRKR